MALRRRTTPARPVEKAGVSLTVVAAVIMCSIVFTGGLHGPLRRTFWILGLVLIIAGSACQLVVARGRRRER